MKIKTLIFILALCIPVSIRAQNLVPNSSFEDYNNCPSSLSGIKYPTAVPAYPTVKGWINPVQNSSPDYLNTCATSGSGANLPDGQFGYQVPRTGNAVAGIIAGQGHIQAGKMIMEYREYIQSYLSQPLLPNRHYCVTFYVSPTIPTVNQYNKIALSKFGANFATTQPTEPVGYTLSLTNDIYNPSNKFITDTNGWTRISGIYTAKGGEQWLTIGFFDDGQDIPYAPLFPLNPPPGLIFQNYTYIDDVSVVWLNTVDTFFKVLDTALCENIPVNLTASSIPEAYKYNWNTGDSTPTINITDTGTYWCVAYRDCEVYIDTFRISYDAPHVLNLGPDIVNCFNQPQTLTCNNTYTEYLWNTGDKTPNLNVTQSGTYILNVKNACGEQSDTVEVAIQPPTPAPIVTDTTICQFTENPQIDVRGTGISNWYLTATGGVGVPYQPPVLTMEPGRFKFYVSKVIGKCEGPRVPVNVTVSYTPHAELERKALMCRDNIVKIGKPQNGVEFLWNTNEQVCCILPQREGMYMVKKTNECGTANDSVYVYFSDCKECIALPTAFSPNSDGVNDKYTPIVNCPVSTYRLRIFNRWGNEVFQSFNPYESWTGYFNNIPADVGVYVYMLEYKTANTTQPKFIQGNITLLK